MPDRAADLRARRARRGRASGRLLRGAARQRGLPHRRLRAGPLVRRRHRPEGDEVRVRALQRRRHGADAAAARQLAARRCTGSGSASTSRLRAQGDRRHDRPPRAPRPHPRRASSASPPTVWTRSPASYERWDGKGLPGELAGDDIPLASRIAQLAEFLEVAHRTGGIDAAVEMAERRSGKQFDPHLVGLFTRRCREGVPRASTSSDRGTR